MTLAVISTGDPAHAASAAIPFRTDAAVAPAAYGMALTVTVLVLAALVGMFVLARRRGWIGASGAMPGIAPKAAHGIEVKGSRRLSMNTGVHIVAYEGRQFLIVESGRGTQSTITALEAVAHPGDEA